MFAALSRRRAVLAGLSAALLCALIALSFLVRHARYEAASRAVRQGLPFLQDMDRLQNEVDVLEHEKSLARHPMLDTLLALAETLPKGIQIATLSISPSGKIALSGNCATVEECLGEGRRRAEGQQNLREPEVPRRFRAGPGVQIPPDLRASERSRKRRGS